MINTYNSNNYKSHNNNNMEFGNIKTAVIHSIHTVLSKDK